MGRKAALSAILTILTAGAGVSAQDGRGDGTAAPRATPTPRLLPPVVATPKPLDTISRNLDHYPVREEISRERREQAYAKLLEGQRHIWSMRQRGQSPNALARLAKAALQKAVELNPNLAEAYTALAELALQLPPNDINDAIALASIAVKIDKNNFGAHRILSRLYTIKSRLNDENFDAAQGQKAIESWREIARLDPRNAEAWAFLSEFYEKTNKPNERIDALQKWLGAAQPVEPRFYRTVMGNSENLSPESASVKLGEALLDAGRTNEAVEVLNQTVADDPDNPEALRLLGRALETADAKTAATAFQSLQQAIYANPDNASLILLYAQLQTRAGNVAEATRFLDESVAALAEKDKTQAAVLQVSVGDNYLRAEKFDEAVAAYRKALAVRGIEANALATDDERDFAVAVFDKIIRTQKLANRPAEAKAAIDAARQVLGTEDSFTDRQLVALLRETGKKAEALQAVRGARLKFPDDYSFLRLEASLLADVGKIDEGVALVKSLMGRKTETPSAAYDDFTNYLFISSLYSDAKRGKQAVEAANQAYQIAQGEERKQIARLTLATAQQMSGDFAGAETTLRGILAQSPNNPIALNNLGYFLVERDEKLDEALKLIQQAVRIDPENSSYLDSLGWAYFKLGKLELAEENLKKALRIDSSSATINEHLGDVYQKQGKPEQARDFWQRALTLSSDAQQIEAIKLKLNRRAPK